MAEILEDAKLRNRLHVFEGRLHAGELLAKKLDEYRGDSGAMVLAIPAGGVPVGLRVSKRLKTPLDVAVTRKIHVPWNREAGFGAVAWDGTILLNQPLVAHLGLSREEVDHCVEREREVIRRRLRAFRGCKPFPELKGKRAIIVDDGLASGFSMLTTAKALENEEAEELVAAIPTAHPRALELIRPQLDKIVCLNIRSGAFFSVAGAYMNWRDIGDEEVLKALKRAEAETRL